MGSWAVTWYFLFTASAIAAGKQADRFFPLAESLVGNGGCGVKISDRTPFDYEIETKAFAQEGVQSFGPAANIFHDRDQAISAAKNSILNNSTHVEKFFLLVDEAVKANKIDALFSATPDHECSKTDSCSVSEFRIYFIDGTLLSCTFDYAS